LKNQLLKNYKHIFFDLDHTLWDFEKNTTEAIEEIYKIFHFSNWSTFTFNDFIKAFHEVNNYLWDKFNHGLIDRLELRNSRFKMVLGKLGVREHDIPKGIGEKYLELAPVKHSVIPFTHEILDYLKPKYRLHIISNGFDDIQHKKLKASNIHHYFEQIVTSDSSGHRKPQKGIFEFAMDEAGANRENSIMIGDNIDTDIIGAQNASMDHVFFNPNNIKHSLKVTFEIDSLREIKNIF
jgi:putative hydrolase of the HAD superfamily